jgi:hypothetical protein
MRDCYPISLFRLEQVLTLFENELYSEAFSLLPSAFVFPALFSEIISDTTRLLIREVALLIFSYLFETSHPRSGNGPFTFLLELPHECHFQQQGASGYQVIPLKPITLIRAMTTVMGLIWASNEFRFDIPLDRISTHPLENFFDLLRWMLHDCHKFDEVVHAAARNAIVHHLDENLAHPRTVG